MVNQITPEEFRWQDANYDHDCAVGRELLFLIANTEWCRATAEKVSVTRSDALETRIEVDVDLARITHEAFRERTGHIWLPILTLPPLKQAAVERDARGRLAVTDATGNPLPMLPDADVTHRIAAAVTEMTQVRAEGLLAGTSGSCCRLLSTACCAATTCRTKSRAGRCRHDRTQSCPCGESGSFAVT
jgi:hypothetical protein